MVPHCPLDFKQGEFYFDCAPWILKGKISISILPPIFFKKIVYLFHVAVWFHFLINYSNNKFFKLTERRDWKTPPYYLFTFTFPCAEILNPSNAQGFYSSNAQE